MKDKQNVGQSGIESRDDRGDRLIQLCEDPNPNIPCNIFPTRAYEYTDKSRGRNETTLIILWLGAELKIT